MSFSCQGLSCKNFSRDASHIGIHPPPKLDVVFMSSAFFVAPKHNPVYGHSCRVIKISHSTHPLCFSLAAGDRRAQAADQNRPQRGSAPPELWRPRARPDRGGDSRAGGVRGLPPAPGALRPNLQPLPGRRPGRLGRRRRAETRRREAGPDRVCAHRDPG